MEPSSKELADWARFELGRDLGHRIAIFHQALADRLGLGVTDVKCLDLIARDAERPITAGRLAEDTGLSTGAITGVIDRLEKAGFVVREKDPSDRRQVRIRAVADRTAAVEALFVPFRAAWLELCSRYDARELAVVDDFLRGFDELLVAESERMRGEPARAEEPSYDVEHPLEGATEGRLELAHFGSPVRLTGTSGAFLVRARADGPLPAITRHGARVTVEGASPPLLSFRKKGRVEIAIADRIPWVIRGRGGFSDLEVKLGDVRLTSLEIGGGASRVSFELGRPEGTVPVRIAGGAHELSIARPFDVPFRIRLNGGASKVRLDELALGAVGGELRYESPTFGAATDRYDFELGGGAHALTVVASR